MAEPIAITTTLNILRLPSQVRLVFAVTVIGLSLVVALVSAIGAMLVLGASALLQHLEPGQPAVIHYFNAFGLILVSQIIILPILSILQVLARPAIIRRRYRTYALSKLNGEAHARFENLIGRTGVQPVPHLLTSDRKIAPQVFGGLSPCLLIPRHVLHTISKEEQSALILHEVAHVHNKDVLIAELSNALVRSFAVSATVLLILCGFVLLSWPSRNLTLRFRDARRVFTEPIQFDVSYIPDTMLVCVSALVLSLVILRISHSITMLLRERRADLGVRYLASREFNNLLILVGRGTGKPGWLAKALQLGPDRWTRHEALVEPNRLIRPNMPFVFLFGVFYGSLAGVLALLLNSLAETSSVVRQVPRIAGFLPLSLDRSSVFLIWSLSLEGLDLVILGWLLIILLSYSIAIPRGLSNVVKLSGWYLMSYIVFWVGLTIPVAIILGFPSPITILIFLFLFALTCGFLVLGHAFPLLSAFFFVWVLQKKMLEAYHLIPRFRRATARWLVYIPVLAAMCLALLPVLTSDILNPQPLVGLAEWLNEYELPKTPGVYWAMLSRWASLGRERYTNSLTTGLPISGAILLMLVIGHQLLNFFRYCCCCGEEVDLDFAFDNTCSRCGYPLGAWVTWATLPDPDEHLKQRGLERIPVFPTRDLGILFTCLAAICGPAWLCYNAFTSQRLTEQIPSGVVRVLLGIPSFFVLASILFLGVAIIFYWLGWLESEKSDSTSANTACDDPSEHQQLNTQPHDNSD